ncbi:MAG: GNAT family N-acetyltransferase [Verrucomicrobiota bacterium]
MSAPEGFAARPARSADAEVIADLMNVVDRSHLEEPDTVDADEVRSWWTRLDLKRDSRVYLDASGRLAAAGTVYARNDGILDLDAYVHPDLLGHGLGAAMVDWLEAEASRRSMPEVRSVALAADRHAAQLLTARGFAPVRHFYRMAIDLTAPPPDPEWPPGFDVSVFQPGEEELLRRVMEEAFSEHWGYEPDDLDHWRRTVFETPWWDPSLVYLVREGDEVAAAEINSVRLGSGWVGSLGTRKPWRGRGLGRALLLTAFGELYRRGETRVALGVDAGNETGATQLYENVGMRIAWQADVYEKHL